MYLKTMKNYSSMNLVFTTEQGNQLWLGDYYAATNLKLLKQKHIDSVLTAAAMLGVRYAKESNISHKIINAFDIPTYKMGKHFDEAFQFIKNSLAKGNVLVHCAAGISRSTTCVLVYLMKEHGYTLKNGLQLVKSKRKVANPNYGFQDQLTRFELFLKKDKLEERQKPFSRQQKRTVREIEKEKVSFMSFLEKEKIERFDENNRIKSRTYTKKKQILYPSINSIIKEYNFFTENRSAFTKSEYKNYNSHSLRPFRSRKW